MKSLFDHLERWRQEPEARRERRALLLASGLTLLLFVSWLASFRLTTSLRQAPTLANSSDLTSQVASPGIIDRLKAGWQAVIGTK